MTETNDARLHVAVLGAGGIGGYYGAKLLAAGHRVSFIARGEHLEALKTRGLTINHPEFQFQQAIEAFELDELIDIRHPEDFDAILLCTKGNSTKELAYDLLTWFENHQHKCPVLSLQNGVENEQVLSKILGPDCVLGGLAIFIGTEVSRPGVITATGIAQLIIGVWPRVSQVKQGIASRSLQRIVEGLHHSGIDTIVAEDIQKELWRKLVINNGVNPLSAVVGLDTQTITRDEQLVPIVKGMMHEAASAARQDGVVLTEDDVEEMFQKIHGFDAIKTSMLIDREKKRPLELDSIAGVVIRNNEAQGFSSPYTRVVSALLDFTSPL